MNLEYSVIGNPLSSSQMALVISAIANSKEIGISDELEDGRLSHIVIKGTKTPIGYIGDDTLEKVNPKDRKLKSYHKLLRNIYNSSVRKTFH